jgi:uncharacterized membrane protein AbrB (regulator of aidB expression)
LIARLINGRAILSEKSLLIRFVSLIIISFAFACFGAYWMWHTIKHDALMAIEHETSILASEVNGHLSSYEVMAKELGIRIKQNCSKRWPQ